MDQRTQDTEGIERPMTEDRRRADRRHSPVAAVPPGQPERRRSSRRHIAGAGLLAALALGGVRYQQHRPMGPADSMEDVAGDLMPEELLDDSAVVDEEIDPRAA